MNPRPIETARDPDLRLSQPAMHRAAQRARALATQTGTAIVVSHNGIIERINPTAEPMPPRVLTVTPLPNHRLAVTFGHGRSGTLDCSSVCQPGDHGIFAPLADTEFFAQVKIEAGALSWPNGASLDPSWIYEGLATAESWSVPFYSVPF